MGKYAGQNRYISEHTTQPRVRLCHSTDRDILDHLETLDNKNGYVKALIRADIAKGGKQMQSKYIVVDNNTNTLESDSVVFDSLEEANQEARLLWQHLTAREKKDRHIYVGYITEEALPEEAYDEDDGSIDWLLYGDHDVPAGAFDSDALTPVD